MLHSTKQSSMFIFVLLFFLAACGSAGPADQNSTQQAVVAAQSKTGDIIIADVSANATGPNGAVYLTLQNNGDQADALITVTSDVAEAVELHESKMDDGNMMQMAPVDSVEVPAGASVALEPGGVHIMLINLKKKPATNDKFQVTLNFKNAGSVPVDVPVSLGASTAEKHAHDDHNDRGHQPKTLAAVDLADGEMLKVVATTTIMGDLVKNVGGSAIDLTVMLPVGADPHSFTPTPQDVAAVANARVVFANGLNLEEFLDQLIENAGGDAVVVSLADGVGMPGLEEEIHDDHQEHPHYGGADPHLWTTPANALVMVHNVEHALAQLDPAGADTYHTNLKSFEAELEALDEWVQGEIESIPAENRKMVSDHDTFGHFAHRYGLEMIGAVVPGYSTNAEPSAQKLAALQDAVGEYGVKAVFVGKSVNPALAERLAQDAGVKLVPLYTGSLGKPGSGAETYIDYIRFNTKAIVEALK